MHSHHTINTKKFGKIHIDESKIITMPKGLPGFIGFNKYVILEDESIKPFCCFQSVDEPELALFIMDPFLFKKDYKVNLKSAIKEMNWDKSIEKSLEIYVVVNIKEDEKKSTKGSAKKAIGDVTANLLSPIIVNPDTFEAIQLIDPDPKDKKLYEYPVV